MEMERLNSEASIRRATRADLPAMMAILNAEISESVSCFRTRPLEGREAEAWWRGRQEGRYPAWVATSRLSNAVPIGSAAKSGTASAADAGGEQVLGWASVSRWSAYDGYDRTAEVSIWILPAAQGRGLGRRLFAELFAYSRDAFGVLLSRIEASNEASIALHEKFGFTRVGTMHRVGEKFGRLLDVVIMECQLDGDTR